MANEQSRPDSAPLIDSPPPLDPMPAEAANLSGHNPALDGIRGLGLILVLTQHFTNYTPASPWQALYYRLAHSGWCGLDFFFVLSGFLITGILWDSKGTPHYFKNFYMRRVLRIFPLYFTALLICMANWRFMYPMGNEAFYRNLPWYWTYTFNLLIALKGTYSVIDNYTTHLWSLCVEEQFYLTWPIVVMLLNRRRFIILCTAGFVIAFIVRLAMLKLNVPPLSIYCFTLSRIDGLLLGCLLAVLARDPRAFQQLRRFARPVIYTLLAVLVLIFIVRGELGIFDPLMLTLGLTLYCVLAMAIITTLIEPGPRNAFHRFFSFPLFTISGKYSYGIYIIHNCFRYPILKYANLLIDHVPPLHWLSGHSVIGGAMVLAMICYGISFAVAWVVWHCYEKRFLKLKRYFEYESKDRPVEQPEAGAAEKA